MSLHQRILIISCSAGLGHVRAAEALETYCQKQYPDINVVHRDLASYQDPLLTYAVVKNYDFTVRYLPTLFSNIFRIVDTKNGQRAVQASAHGLMITKRALQRHIAEFKPTRIIATHFLAPYLLSNTTLPCPLDVVITDYYPNLVWLGPNVRMFFVATSEIADTLHTRSTPAIASGIPIHPDFYTTKPTTHHEIPHIVVMPTGHNTHSSDIVSELNTLSRRITCTAIAGHDKHLLHKLENLKKHTSFPYRVFGYTTKTAQLMSEADIIISKPGGLTTTEALYLRKKLIVIKPTDGQERYNADYVIKYNFGLQANNAREAISHVESIIAEKKHLVTPLPSPIAQEIILQFPRRT